MPLIAFPLFELLAITAFGSTNINIGTNVVFADASETNSAWICQDLSNMLAFARSLEDVFANGTVPGAHRVRGKDPMPDPSHSTVPKRHTAKEYDDWTQSSRAARIV